MTKDESDELQICLSGFTVEAQRKIKEALGIKSADELNLDTFPLFLLPKPDQ